MRFLTVAILLAMATIAAGDDAVPPAAVRKPIPERLVVLTPGGAGIGDPKQRTRAEIERDVEAGLVSPDTAREVYGLRREAAE